MDAETRDAAKAGPHGARVLEWFRTEPRPSVQAALLPAILCATLGWLLLGLAGRASAPRPGPLGTPAKPTLPAAAIVDAEGEPAGLREIRPIEQAMRIAGALLVMGSPLVLVHLLRKRSRARVIELVIRTDALVVRDADEETVVPWEELEEARLGRSPHAPATITLARHDGSELELEARFGGISPEELASRIRSVRGRALFGLLETPTWPERAHER